MGARESRASILSYDEAVKRVTATELQRIQDAYKRVCGVVGIMREPIYLRDVLGDNVPPKLAQRIFAIMSTHSRGMSFRDVLVSLVLLTRGRQEERLKMIFAVYCDEHNPSVTSKSMSDMVFACEKTALPHEAHSLFKHNDNVSYDQFRMWVLDYPDITSVTRWLVNSSGITVSLTDDMEMPNFYQTLAGVTHLEESDITELEKRYWQLKSQSKTGKFDLNTFKNFVCPPLPSSLVQGLFNAFDENKDGHIDFKEISCGVSACCRGPLAERQKFCYKIFDSDEDSKLNESELKAMALGLLEVQKANSPRDLQSNGEKDIFDENSEIVQKIISHVMKHSSNECDCITLEEYQLWSLEDPLPTILLNIVIEICHIVLGLRPSSPQEEGTIVRGWMHRANHYDYRTGETWYVISGKWWSLWKQYTNYDPTLSTSTSASWEHAGEESDEICGRTSSSDTIGSAHEATEVMPHAMPSSKSIKARGRLPGRVQRVSESVSAKPHPSPGPVNNSDILLEENTKVGTLTDEGGKIKDNLVKGVDYIVLPAPVWKALHHWYGGSPALPRIVPASEHGEKSWLELHRLHIMLLRHQLPSSMQQLSQIAFPGTGPLAGVGNTTLGMLKQSLNYMAGGSSTPKRHIAHRATFSRRHTVGQVISFLSQRLRIPAENMRLWHLLDENNANLLDDEPAKLESLNISNHAQILLEVRNMDMSWPEELSQIARNHKQKIKQAGTKQVMTLGGVTGLSNLGNTCFMNSSLQCISNTQPLTKYFLESKHLYELNRTNTHGMKGHIAKRYSDLAQDLWSGTNKTIAPLKIRWTISKYAPLFNGFSQHDSQELLAFLLDGLHEDLNRVQEKPYKELKDSAGRPDEEVAQEAWENHLSRNQSIIIDLFHGQIRSRVRCMQCDTVSVRFDPFTFLSLPLPMDNLMYFDVIVIRLNGKTPIRYGLRLSMDDTFLEVRKHLSVKCEMSIEAILLVEVIGATIKSFLSDNLKVRSSTLGNLYAYEIPPPRKAGSTPQQMPNGDLNHELTNGNNHRTVNRTTEKGNPGNIGSSFKAHIGSSVHETSKQSITNHAAMRITSKVASSETDSNAAAQSADKLTRDNVVSKTELGDNIHISRSRGQSTFYISNQNENGNKVAMKSSPSLERVAGSGDNDIWPLVTDFSSTNYPGYVVGFHRKIFHSDVYFLSSQKHRPSLFGFPIVVPCLPGQPNRLLYSAVWKLVSRFVSPLPPSEAAINNHAQDCDGSLGSQYPFVLRCVERTGIACGNACPWFRFCKGCLIKCNDEQWQQSTEYIAIDWDPTALHLRYQPSVEREVNDDVSVEEGHRGQQQRINLSSCLRAFTSEEELGKDELYQCGTCKKPQLAKKKLDIWRLPPVLIVHLKRFQYVNGRWIKSHKVVDFPQTDFDPSNFMSKRDEAIDAEPSKPAGARSDLCNGDDHHRDDENEGADAEPNSARSLVNSKGKAHISFIDDEVGEESETRSTTTEPVGSHYVKESSVDSREVFKSTSKPVNGGGPARRRQPSFREDSPPLYDLYAVSCHSGILGGGHYIAYAKNKYNRKWYCYNDSSCKEVPADSISVETAYTLFYQRQGIDYEDFMPSIAGKTPVNTDTMDDDYNSEFKKYCVIQ